MTGTYELNSAAPLVSLSPSGEVVAIATGTSIQFFSAISGNNEGTINQLCSGKYLNFELLQSTQFPRSKSCILGQITTLQFDSTGKYLLVCADRYVRIFHNVPGYKVALEVAQEKLRQPKISAATRERIEFQIAENDAFLKKFE